MEAGIPKKTENGYEITPQIEENLEFIKRFVKGTVLRNSGTELIEAPKFTEKEAVQIVLRLKNLLDNLFIKETKLIRG